MLDTGVEQEDLKSLSKRKSNEISGGNECLMTDGDYRTSTPVKQKCKKLLVGLMLFWTLTYVFLQHVSILLFILSYSVI